MHSGHQVSLAPDRSQAWIFNCKTASEYYTRTKTQNRNRGLDGSMPFLCFQAHRVGVALRLVRPRQLETSNPQQGSLHLTPSTSTSTSPEPYCQAFSSLLSSLPIGGDGGQMETRPQNAGKYRRKIQGLRLDAFHLLGNSNRWDSRSDQIRSIDR